MSDTTPNIVLDTLRAIRGSIAEVKSVLAEVKQRLSMAEVRFGAQERNLAGLTEQYAHLSACLNRLGADISLIKRRLDFVEASGDPRQDRAG